MMLAGPEDVDSCSMRIISKPEVGGSMAQRRAFFYSKANTTIHLRISLPVEGVFSFSDGTIVSQPGLLKAGDAILSLDSSLSMTAVFLASSICLRFAEKPGHMVLTFQLAMQRAGDFFCIFLFL